MFLYVSFNDTKEEFMDQNINPADYQICLSALRDVLKAKDITYAHLAKKIGVSEVTIKRWLTGHGISVKNIFEICSVIGVSFFDVVAHAQHDEEVDYVLNLEQEKSFAKAPGLFGFLKQLHSGEKPTTLAKVWNLNSKELFKILRKLEQLDVLEIFEDNKVRLKTRGNIRYSHQGPLAKAILRPQISQFLDHVDATLKNKDVCYHSVEVELSENHIKEFVKEIHELGSKYRAKALRDKNLMASKKLKSVRWLFAFAPYQTNWQRYLL